MPQTGGKIYKDGRAAREHVFKAEKVLGRRLRNSEMVHHIDEDSSNNNNNNLVICPNMAYHALLHIRTEALNCCGNANYRRCIVCKTWDDPATMINHNRHKPNGTFRHTTCKLSSGRAYTVALRKKRRLATQALTSVTTVIK